MAAPSHGGVSVPWPKWVRTRLGAEVDKRHLTCILLAASHFAPLITACVIKVHPGHASEDLTGHRAGTWSPGAGPASAVSPPDLSRSQTPLGQQQCAVRSQTSHCPSLGLSGLKVESLFQRRKLCFCPSLSSHTWGSSCGLLIGESMKLPGQASWRSHEASGQSHGCRQPQARPHNHVASSSPCSTPAWNWSAESVSTSGQSPGLVHEPNLSECTGELGQGRGAHVTEESSSPIYR